MSIAGIAIADGRLIWAESLVPLAPLDRVALALNGEEIEGTVLVAPDQFLWPPASAAGTVVRVLPQPIREPACDPLPGADLPPLGSEVVAGSIAGRVTSVDPVARTITIIPSDGGEAVTVPAERACSA